MEHWSLQLGDMEQHLFAPPDTPARDEEIEEVEEEEDDDPAADGSNGSDGLDDYE
jgi:hypothetical protein